MRLTSSSSYEESITFLYTHNTFIFLQNNTLYDFYHAIPAKHSALIRSIHIHWLIRQVNLDYAIPKNVWHQGAFVWTIYVLCQKRTPGLEHLSIFFQGPLRDKFIYHNIIHDLEIVGEMRDLQSFVVRMPHAMPAPYPSHGYDYTVDERLAGSQLPFQLIRPHGDVADQDVGIDVGWRFGSCPVTATTNKAETALLQYLVWTPMPRSSTWPYRPGVEV